MRLHEILIEGTRSSFCCDTCPNITSSSAQLPVHNAAIYRESNPLSQLPEFSIKAISTVERLLIKWKINCRGHLVVAHVVVVAAADVVVVGIVVVAADVVADILALLGLSKSIDHSTATAKFFIFSLFPKKFHFFNYSECCCCCCWCRCISKRRAGGAEAKFD